MLLFFQLHLHALLAGWAEFLQLTEVRFLGLGDTHSTNAHLAL